MFVPEGVLSCGMTDWRRAREEKKMFDTSDTGDAVAAWVSGGRMAKTPREVMASASDKRLAKPMGKGELCARTGWFLTCRENRHPSPLRMEMIWTGSSGGAG